MKRTVAMVLALVVVFAAIGIFSLVSVGGDGNGKLTGTWVCEISVDGYPDGLVIYEDGTGIIDGYDCNWEVENDRMHFEVMSIFVGDLDYDYQIKGKVLYLDGFRYTKTK